MSNFRERLRTLKTGLCGRPILRMRSIRCAFLVGCKCSLRFPKLVTLEKMIDQKRLAPESLIYPVRTTLPMGFSWAMFFCQDVTHHRTLAGCADSPHFVSHHRCSVEQTWHGIP